MGACPYIKMENKHKRSRDLYLRISFISAVLKEQNNKRKTQ